MIGRCIAGKKGACKDHWTQVYHEMRNCLSALMLPRQLRQLWEHIRHEHGIHLDEHPAHDIDPFTSSGYQQLVQLHLSGVLQSSPKIDRGCLYGHAKQMRESVVFLLRCMCACVCPCVVLGLTMYTINCMVMNVG